MWTRVTQTLGNGGPRGMLSIPKPIKIKVLLQPFSLLMFNLHDMFHVTVFLPDLGIAAFTHFFRKCRTIFSPRAQRRKTKNKNNTLWELSFQHAFYLIRVVRVAWPV